MEEVPDPNVLRDLGEISVAVTTVDNLCVVEYGIGLVVLLNDADSELSMLRLRRLAGLALKEPFATIDGTPPKESATGARRSWIWDPQRLIGDQSAETAPEYQILSDLSAYPDRWGYPDSIEGLMGVADGERGLFKVITYWLRDKFSDNDMSTSLAQYYKESETKPIEIGLDVATLLAGSGVTLLLASVAPVASLVVPLALLALKYGEEALFGKPDDPYEQTSVPDPIS